MVNYLKQAWLVLLLAGGLGVTLSLVEAALQERIEQNARDRLEAAVLRVVPEGKRSEPTTVADHRAYRVFDESNRQVGWALVAETMGFVDRIDILIGVSLNGSEIRGVAVLSSRETPGLGDRINGDKFLGQFIGRPTNEALEVVRPGESAVQSVDAISGATISSRAVVKAVNDCIRDTLGELVDVTTGGSR